MSFITDVFANMLLNLNGVVGDWGVTIILITLIIKVVLIPLSIKQKKVLLTQSENSKEMETIKERYKKDKAKLESEMERLSKKQLSSMKGCLVTLIQLPIMIGLYGAISSIPLEIGTTIVFPWLMNIKLPDQYFLIPLISIAVQLLPNVFYWIKSFSILELTKPSMATVLPVIAINLLIVTNAPAIIGIYWITSGIYTLVEQFVFNIYRLKTQVT